MSSQMLFGDLGGPELILIAAIALLLAGASRLFSREQSHDRAEAPSLRAYLDRLLGPARRLVSADALPGTGTQPRIARALEIVVPS